MYAESAVLLAASSIPRSPEWKTHQKNFQHAIQCLRSDCPENPGIPELEAEWLLRARGTIPDRPALLAALAKAENGLRYPKLLSEAEIERGLRHPISPTYAMSEISHQGRTYALIGEIQLALADRAKGVERTK